MASPLEKLKQDGAAALGPIELLAVVLTQEDDDSMLHIKDAKDLLESHFGTIRNVARFATAMTRRGADGSTERAASRARARA